MAKAFWSTETNLNDSKILKTIRAPKSVTVKPKPEDIPSFGDFLEFVLSTDLLGTGFSSHWVPYWRACTPCHFKYSGVDHKIQVVCVKGIYVYMRKTLPIIFYLFSVFSKNPKPKLIFCIDFALLLKLYLSVADQYSQL